MGDLLELVKCSEWVETYHFGGYFSYNAVVSFLGVFLERMKPFQVGNIRRAFYGVFLCSNMHNY